MTEPLRFLLVDDDADDLDLFAAILKETDPGISIATAGDGSHAVTYLENCMEVFLPHALVIDYNMPQMNGAQFLEWICKNPKYHGIAKFMLSTSSQPEYRDGCLKKGALEYFVKPARVEDIKMIAEEIVAYCKRITRTSHP